MVAWITLMGFALPWDLVTTSVAPTNSRTARIEIPAMIPVPGGAGLRRVMEAPCLAIISCGTVEP